MEEIKQLFHYIQQSPTAFHAVAAAKNMLSGFQRLQEFEKWDLKPGGRYMVSRNDSSLIAFTMPNGSIDAFHFVAAHSDSPTFKIKDNAELVAPDRYVRLDTEGYGGMIMSAWYDRPLSVAGRVVVSTDRGIETKLINLDRDMVIIPNVAIHMNREVNRGYKYNPACDLMPLWGSGNSKGSFRQAIAEAAGVEAEAILGSDLYLYNRVPGTVWGEENAYLSCGRLDDLECVYAGIRALQKTGSTQHVNMLCIFDNEEVGSGTRQGADSTFLSDVLSRIALAAGMDDEALICSLQRSMMLSADNAHADHPNHPELSDPINKVFMNGGVVMKYNANQKYTTDGVSAALFREICRRKQVPVQCYANRSDMPGGSTLGNISGSHVSVPTVDIGLAQLAMHSPYETAGVHDLAMMIDAMTGFYDVEFKPCANGWTME